MVHVPGRDRRTAVAIVPIRVAVEKHARDCGFVIPHDVTQCGRLEYENQFIRHY